ncbi:MULTISPECIES: archaeal heat shock protein Hsp14 [Acidianus]|uniref:Heat-shock protein Hsp20 n=1 Tax=Candidatus Acidianus copahuensis TaxID=1160895 RepID=A0A031LRK2_9CREN|nr:MULTISPECIES: archaeal heat shock protein Hsp14 [Acidianus]EZQ07049.1 heat-shock protein Hsp20 [Candidatus Acidianus copahuensis]NON63073.1 Hsp20/alpha crystallin family protein [Acidianus sp. RZ1]
MEILLSEVTKQMNSLNRQFYERISPPVDMYEDGNKLVVLVDLPGFDKNKISVRITTDGVLHIEASRDVEMPGIKHLTQRPARVGKDVKLPVKVPKDAEVYGKYENGVLTLTIPIEGLARVKIE